MPREEQSLGAATIGFHAVDTLAVGLHCEATGGEVECYACWGADRQEEQTALAVSTLTMAMLLLRNSRSINASAISKMTDQVR